jgi:hypothetical protein
MRKNHLLTQIDPAPAARAPCSRDPLSNAVDGQDRSLIEWRAQERACRMGKMVFAEKNSILGNSKFRRNGRPHPKLVNHPGDHRFAENLVRLRVRLQNRHQNPVELSKGLFEKCNVVDIVAANTGCIQAVLNGVPWKAVVVLHAGEAFFFRGRDQLTVAQECGGCIMVIAGNSKNIHLALVASPFEVILWMLEPSEGPLFDV